MSRYLMVTWDGAGNLVSTLGIAERLVEAGHDVRLLGHPAIHTRCGDRGWRFRPFRHTAEFDSTQPYDVANEMTVHARDLWFSPTVGADVIEELESEPADVVIADCMLAGALSAAQGKGVPTVALFHSPISGFRGGPMVELLAPSVPLINGFRRDLGLEAVTSLADIHDACVLSLVATPREFDVDVPLPNNVRFIGPILDGPPISQVVDDVAIDDGPDPLVVVSFSTSYQAQRDTLQHVVSALADFPAAVVVTTGSAIAPDTISAGANTRVVGYVPHDQVLSRASAVLTHAGLGTVLTALSHGVPLVCMPMGRDQFFNAAMVERLGAGRVVPPDADPATLRAIVDAVLADTAVKDAAKRVAGMIAGYGGAAAAVHELEQIGS